MSGRIEGTGIHFAYAAEDPVLRGVDAAIATGSLTAIVGPNGAGKSTLLRILCGLLKPHSGQVSLDGSAVHALSPRARAQQIAFLPQSVAPAFALNVFEVVCLGRHPHMGALAGLSAHDHDVAERCLRDTRTDHLRERDFMTLSGGERQRVLLAGILAQEPALLLLDEPTSALDLHHATEIGGLLRRLAADGYGIGMVTHDLNLAARFCDYVILLGNEGPGLIAAGKPAEVLTSELLSQAYGAAIRVSEHPESGSCIIWAETTGGVV